MQYANTLYATMTIPDSFNLKRFLGAQECFYEDAIKEIMRGYKESHWIWFVFPQMRGLGRSPMAENYGIKSIEEAHAYLEEPILKKRLIEISSALLKHKGKSTAYEILGTLDAIKVRSSMTLFDHVMPNAIFADVLDAFYNGERDVMTLELLKQ